MFDEKTPVFNIDWLHGSMPGLLNIQKFLYELEALDPDKLNIKRWAKWSRGLYNYSTRLCLNDKATINVAWVQDDNHVSYYAVDTGFNPGCFVSISGDGIRYLGSELLAKVMKLLFNYGFRCSRIDINCDIFDKTNDVIPMYLEAIDNYRRRNFGNGDPVMMCCGSKKINFVSYYDLSRSVEVLNVTMGNKASDRCMFRIYDKYYEITNGRLSSLSDEMLKDIPSDYWYRIEFEVHKKYAEGLFNDFVLGKCTVAQAFVACCRFYRVIESRYVTKLDNCLSTQGPEFEVWSKFLQVCSMIQNEYLVVKHWRC